MLYWSRGVKSCCMVLSLVCVSAFCVPVVLDDDERGQVESSVRPKKALLSFQNPEAFSLDVFALPKDVWPYILQFLDHEARNAFKQVCKTARQIVWEACEDLTISTKGLIGQPYLLSETVAPYDLKIRHVTLMNTGNLQGDHPFLSTLLSLPSLTSLRLSKFSFESKCLLPSYTLREGLQHLDLSSNGLKAPLINRLTFPKTLVSLNLSDNKLKGGIDGLNLPETLTRLSIGSNGLEIKDLQELGQKNLTNLEALALREKYTFYSETQMYAFLHAARQFPKLASLELTALQTCENEDDLSFDFAPSRSSWSKWLRMPEHERADFLKEKKKLQLNLTSLTLNDVQITEEQFAMLMSSRLQKLDLSHSTCLIKAVDEMIFPKSLTHLDLRGFRIEPTRIDAIRNMLPHLQTFLYDVFEDDPLLRDLLGPWNPDPQHDEGAFGAHLWD